MFITELYEKYMRELSSRLGRDVLSFEDFCSMPGSAFEKMDKVEIDEPSEKGVIYYRLLEDGDRFMCNVPVWGYYASSVRVMARLFSMLSDMLVRQKSTLFEVHLYAHDLEAQRLFSMMQFGCMAETGIIRQELPCRNAAPFIIRTPDNKEIEREWGEIWSMTDSIISHLRNAPIFYPGAEFTENVYRDFFLDNGTHLHVAYDEACRMTGMIETNSEPSSVIASNAGSANIGEVYVIPEMRGKGLADALFFHALRYEKERGAKYLWVEHGTANPNARGFWGRYFKSYEYEFDRTIEKL